MAKQSVKSARATILDHFGDIRNLQAVLDAPLSLGDCVNSMGLDAFSEKGLLKLAGAIEAARKQSVADMPEDELAEATALAAASRLADNTVTRQALKRAARAGAM